MRDWWKRAEEAAFLTPVVRRGWHSLRRKFATELKNMPLKDLSDLGGWKNAETILKCYQWPDTETQREALRSRRPILKAHIRS